MNNPWNKKNIIDFKLKCSKCDELKPLEAFYVRKDCTFGYSSQCKPCDRARRANLYNVLPDTHPDIAGGKRRCNVCKQEKSLSSFGKTKRGKFGRGHKCKPCRVLVESRRQGKYLYGISFDEKINMLTSQSGLCANRACGKEIKFDTVTRSNMACVDHDHKTGKIRALLCSRCNWSLGFIENNKTPRGLTPNLVLGLTEYLQKHTGG